MAAWAPPCVGRLHGVLTHLRARGRRSRFHRACPMDATLERDAAPGPTAFSFAPARSHPQRARRRAEQGSLWDVTPETRKGRRATRLGRLHCRIPTSGAAAPSCAGPCSAFRREAQIAPVAHARLDQSFPRPRAASPRPCFWYHSLHLIPSAGFRQRPEALRLSFSLSSSR